MFEYSLYAIMDPVPPKCRNAEALGVLMASLVDAGGYGDPTIPMASDTLVTSFNCRR